MTLFVTAAAGTEGALKAELVELGLRGVRADRGGVRVPGGREQAATICLRSRIAVRVLVPLAEFECRDEDALYEGVREIGWQRFLHPEMTLAVTSVARDSRLTHTNFIAQRTKDAIVDQQREDVGRRSSVDRHDPDLGVFVHLKRNVASVFIDASGGSLHLRGWRARGGEAPLKETLAAAIVRLSGWDRVMPLRDPLCGSGTIPIEADLIARSIPPQSPKRVFGFERWADFDIAPRMEQLRARAEEHARESGPSCVGSDRDAVMIEDALEHARRARSRAEFRVSDLAGVVLEERTQLILNPPYGERLEAGWRELALGLDRLRDHRITVLLPEDAPRDLLRGEPVSVHRLFNGALPCRLVTWD
jgi:23S rRNA G2445 N2-methylase RlmL